MLLQSLTDRVYNALKGSGALEECIVLKAFPYADKPTRLTKTYITVSPAEAELKSVALGENVRLGKCSVRLDVFAPQRAGTPAGRDVMDLIIAELSALEPLKIKAFPFESRDELGAFSAKCVADFSGYTELEQEDENG